MVRPNSVHLFVFSLYCFFRSHFVPASVALRLAKKGGDK